MSPILTLLVLFFTSLIAGLPIQLTSQNNTTHLLNSVAPDISIRALAMSPTANPPFDPWEFNNNEHRTDGDLEGDIIRLSKCFCVDTPSRDLPAAYGQYYGSYYGYDYYNYHSNQSYAFSLTCASGELETLNSEFASAEFYWLAPKCLAWMEDERHECWDTGDGNKFCVESWAGKDVYHWNGQKRIVHNHPSAPGTLKMPPAQLNEECQRMCQTIPANTEGWMQDVIPSDYEHKINLATATACSEQTGIGMATFCTGPQRTKPKVWETWNYIETYSDQADMCKGCA